MRGSVRIFESHCDWKEYREILKKTQLSHWDRIEFFYIERDDKRLYIENREYTKDFIEFSDIKFKVNGFIEYDLVNNKMTKYCNFRNHYYDSNLLTYLGVEFLLSDCINNKTYSITFNDFTKAIFKIYTKPTDILKVELIKNGFDLQNFPMSEFKRVISLDKRYWQNKVSHYHSIYYYMKRSLDLTMFFKHISKLKKMALVDMFVDAETLGYKVNMRWSYNRIKDEHENWSHEIRDNRLLSEDNEFLETGYTYPTIDGGELLTSKYALVYEGKDMNHCVGGSGYWDLCARGISAIYKYQDKESKRIRATIELRINQKTGEVTLNQMQRKGNRLYVPDEIKEKIRQQLKGYKIPEIINYNKQLDEIY